MRTIHTLKFYWYWLLESVLEYISAPFKRELVELPELKGNTSDIKPKEILPLVVKETKETTGDKK